MFKGWQCTIPQAFWSSLRPRKNQILGGEVSAALCTLLALGEQARGRRIIFFIDNVAACHVLAKGGCSEPDVQYLVTALHIHAAKMHCVIWFEWVPSKANASDGLSRLIHCKWVASAEMLFYPKWLLKPMSIKTLKDLTARD